MDTTYYDYENEIIYELPPEALNMLNEKDGKFLFAAYGCVITVRQVENGTYAYTATNLFTGQSMIISRRRRELTESAYVDVAVKISESPIRGERRFSIDKKPNGKTGGTELTKVAAHIFKEILPKYGYAVRGKQIELTEHILGVIEKRGLSLAESEVGTGKTHAYLIATILAKRGRLNDFWLRGHYKKQSWAESAYMPVVISTSSIALQNAIVKDYIPELSEILLRYGVINTPLTAFVRKGKEHYICEERLLRFYEGTNLQTQELLDPFIGNGAPFDLTDAGTLSAYVKKRICVKGKCGDFCEFRDECRYTRYLLKANDPRVDFQITNHNYFLADNLHRVRNKKPLLPNYQLVIMDEGHKFLAAARSMYGLELTDTELLDLVEEVYAFTSDKTIKGREVKNLAVKLTEQSRTLFKQLNDNIPKTEKDDEAERLPVTIDNAIVSHLAGIARAASALAEVSADYPVKAVYRDRLARTVWRLEQTAERVSSLCKKSKLIYWLENHSEGEAGRRALCATRKDLNARLFNDLWSGGIPIILTSGTLSASGDFTRPKETLGLNKMPERKLFDVSMLSPFDYKNNAMLYISENTASPDNKNERYISSVANEIERLVRASHGHAAVLFTSYNVMGKVHNLLKKRGLPFPLFRLERGGTHAIEQFKKSGNGILLAAGSLWEGIDIPGDTLSMLIIVKLPFAVPDPLGEYERSLYGNMEIYKARVIVPDMLVKLKQGFGRLIRNETDTGVIAILDSRVNNRGAYRDRVIGALPNCDITSRIRAVKRFFNRKKQADYFMDGRELI